MYLNQPIKDLKIRKEKYMVWSNGYDFDYSVLLKQMSQKKWLYIEYVRYDQWWIVLHQILFN